MSKTTMRLLDVLGRVGPAMMVAVGVGLLCGWPVGLMCGTALYLAL